MSYVIYNKETTLILSAPARSVGCYVESYKTAGAAKAALTRLDKKGKLGKTQDILRTKEDFAIAEAGEFHTNIEKTVTRRNIMNGKEFQESVNTPNSCSPASETYWSM